ncbi:MAG TPA: enoyl-CoA hydratase/isomerase family protein [Polyangiales bacterium]|nr:enoyl-CoA hydratase/isomerase family protein [Polyangiales bacterium]
MITLERQDGVWVLRMNDGENRFNERSVSELLGALDEVERSSEPGALVTVGTGKFYSNGLDLEYISKLTAAEAQAFVGRVHELLARLLYLPLISVAAVNGHAFAAGAMFMLAHDYRVMRSDRGYFCLPEVDIHIPFTPPMATLIQARLPKLTAHEAMVTGKRYAAEEARARQIIDLAAEEARVLPEAIAIAKTYAGKSRATLAAIKRGAYPQMQTAVNDYAALPGGNSPIPAR